MAKSNLSKESWFWIWFLGISFPLAVFMMVMQEYFPDAWAKLTEGTIFDPWGYEVPWAKSEPEPEPVVTSSQAIASFKARIAKGDPQGQIITNIEPGIVSGEVVIIVANIWHQEVKQNRLQMAQNLWKIWASESSPQEPDKARIKIVDQNGNWVGGSGLTGSLISVAD